jgi:hypothetical protein
MPSSTSCDSGVPMLPPTSALLPRRAQNKAQERHRGRLPIGARHRNHALSGELLPGKLQLRDHRDTATAQLLHHRRMWRNTGREDHPVGAEDPFAVPAELQLKCPAAQGAVPSGQMHPPDASPKAAPDSPTCAPTAPQPVHCGQPRARQVQSLSGALTSNCATTGQWSEICSATVKGKRA